MSNLSYLEDLYRTWSREPGKTAPAWERYFRDIDAGVAAGTEPGATPRATSAESAAPTDMVYKQSRVDSLLWAYRDVGYVYANLNPLGDHGPRHDYLSDGPTQSYEALTLEAFGLSEQDLDTVFFAGRAMQPSRAPLRGIIAAFRQTYCAGVGVEFLHVQDRRVRHWLIGKMESTRNTPRLDAGQRRIILEDLLRTEALETALGTYFMGQKRFSLEGSESIIPALHFLVDSAQRYGIEEVVIGTTHRGRLSILNTILHMTPEEIFSHFLENHLPEAFGGGGDVKYHLGYDTDHIHDDGTSVHVSLAANSSHLESVDPIAVGKTRALQDAAGGRERKRIVPVVLHGDSAFCGQGVVAETLNLSQLEGYGTRGTVHIIINNQIGFTTPARSARSSVYPTDVAKSLQVPIFHVNGDDPEAIVHVVDLALQFRHAFGRDAVVDVFCYRKHGHNEGDEPSFTHPRMYRLIAAHPPLTATYGERCAALGVIGREEQQQIASRLREELKQAVAKARAAPVTSTSTIQRGDWQGLTGAYRHDPVETGVAKETLLAIARHVTAVPVGFHAHPKLERILAQKRGSVEGDGNVDWAFAETLAFGSLLLEGTPVRLSGEDCVRGTFSQRHLTWWDTETEQPHCYTPLATLPGARADFAAFDSPLSEYAVLGFEYGYSLIRPRSLVAWEAQFGDFANGAQVVIDNYLAAAETKWRRLSGLVLLLPHGDEGQGPDHASARPERFLQLCARDNLQVCNASTPAQYFHLLRRQMKRDFRRPLVILTPKSLLRHPAAVSPLSELADGRFLEVLDDPESGPEAQRVVLCSGKVYYDLVARRREAGAAGVALVRLEQLYPFPVERLRQCLQRHPQARSVVWLQEEPRNGGCWAFIREQFALHFAETALAYAGREASPSPASGLAGEFKRQQAELVARVFGGSDGKGTSA